MNDEMGGLIGAIAAMIAIGLFIVYVVIPILSVLFGIGVLITLSVAGAGFIFGLGVGVKNFFEVFTEAHDRLP